MLNSQKARLRWEGPELSAAGAGGVRGGVTRACPLLSPLLGSPSASLPPAAAGPSYLWRLQKPPYVSRF